MQITFLLSVLAATVAVQASDVYNQCVPDKDCCFSTKGACQRQASVWIEKYFQCGQVKKCPDYGVSLQDCNADCCSISTKGGRGCPGK
ncbi:hypothetical protein AA0116_g4065 [Alternaria tenuissima]|nr:hypothetical protein AA0116_g4065 [Alternaria tenuissima]